ncbi:MAG: TetR/AcrR family transcriptional regulator [Cumulibacter sp.]
MSETSSAGPSPAGRVTARPERSQIARQRMITSAIELIAEGGLAYATLARIGEHAGYSRGLADYHFGSKTELVEQLVEHVARSWEHALAPVRRDQVHGLTALVLELRSYMMRSEAHPLAARVLSVLSTEALTATPEIKNTIARHDESFRRRLRRWIIEAQDDGTIYPHIDPVHASVLIQGTLRGVTLQWTVSPESFRPTEIADLVINTTLSGLCRPAGIVGLMDITPSAACDSDGDPAVESAGSS